MPHAARLWLILSGILAAAPVWADGPESHPTGVGIRITEVGFAGQVRLGEWIPIAVEVVLDKPVTGRLQFEAPDPDGDRLLLTGRRREFPQGLSRHWGCVRIGRPHARVRAALLIDSTAGEAGTEDGSRPAATAERSLLAPNETALALIRSQSRHLIAVVGNPGGCEPAADRFDVARLESVDQLPDDARGYRGLTALLLTCGANDELLGSITAAQSTALQGWVQSGGHLLVSCGDAGLWAGSPIAAWIPIPVTGQAEVRELSGLESFATRIDRIAVEAPVRFLLIDPAGGQALAKELTGPVVVQAPHGMGRVTLIGVDVDRPPLAGWKSLSAVMRRLMLPREIDAGTASKATTLARSGVSDLATQLQNQITDFPEVRRPGVAVISFLLVAYIVWIGPIDYFLVRRWLRRPHGTWATFPLAVAGVVLLTAAGAAWVNGRALRVNVVEICDVDLAGGPEGRCRVAAFAGLYDASSRARNVALGLPEGSQSQGVLTWHGVPEESIGGLHREGRLQFTDRSYRLDESTSVLTDVPNAQWSTRCLQSDWIQAAPFAVEYELSASGIGLLSGTLRHNAAAPLEDVVLAYANRAYVPARRGPQSPAGLWEPNLTWELDQPRATEQRELRGFLNRVAVRTERGASTFGPALKQAETPYDPFSKNRGDVLRMLTFYQLAGGQAYTNLRNGPLSRFDLSPLIRLDRAVLLARFRTPLSRVVVDGQERTADQHDGFVRIVFPVKRSAKSDAEFFEPLLEKEERR